LNKSRKFRNKKPSEVKTIIHQITNTEKTNSNGSKPKSVDFVSEEDVKRAIEKGEKIFIAAKTIITPSARDLGEEREIFAKFKNCLRKNNFNNIFNSKKLFEKSEIGRGFTRKKRMCADFLKSYQ
jgi:hypothetical protein